MHDIFALDTNILIHLGGNADCNILYSEDMKHNLLVLKQLKIINPYI